MSHNLFDFDYTHYWPAQESYPINNSAESRTVKSVILKDITASSNYIIVTGFTSLANIVEIFGAHHYPKLQKVRIVLGFEPELRKRKRWPDPGVNLSKEIKDYWLKQNVSITLGGAIISVIEQINSGQLDFRCFDGLHAKIYAGDRAAVLGSANFSKNGLTQQQEANIRVLKDGKGQKETEQHTNIKRLAENFYESAKDYNQQAKDLLTALLSEATWEEALARAIAEVIEGEWIKEYPHLLQAILKADLWPSQQMGIAKAMYVIQNFENVLVADPTGSGKTKMSTALALTLFHWLWENGKRDKSNAVIISPPQVVDTWQKEQSGIRFFHDVQSMGILSMGSDERQRAIRERIQRADILIIDEAHNYLNPDSKRSGALSSHKADHIILSTATPINKKTDDLLRLVELLDVDNLTNEDLSEFRILRDPYKRKDGISHLDKLRTFISQFIVRRTKKQLNQLIDREKDKYKNALGNECRFPDAECNIYTTGETDKDKKIAAEINELTQKLKGLNYLQNLKVPPFYCETEEEKERYINRRLSSGPALAAFMIKSKLRSSHCALIEYLEGSVAAMKQFHFKTLKTSTGDVIGRIEGLRFEDISTNAKKFLPEWLLKRDLFNNAKSEEVACYKRMAALARQFSGTREQKKAEHLITLLEQHNKVLAFDSTIITLDYLKKIINEKKSEIDCIVVTGQNEKNKAILKAKFSLSSDSTIKAIALCSDAMSEGINLQGGRAVVLLDMPSVLRIIEQRIGRLERMDSDFKVIHTYWPNDSKEFSLNGDRRLIEVLNQTEHVIGNNVNIPQALYEKHIKNKGLTAQNLINVYKDSETENHEWEGIRDSFEPIYQLKDPPNAIIPLKTYEKIRNVSSEIRTRVSFVNTGASWAFFAFRGDAQKSPHWFFLTSDENVLTDFPEICRQLRIHLAPDKIKQEHWTKETDVYLKNFAKIIRRKEKLLLPNKRKRALETAEKILRSHLRKTKDKKRINLINTCLELFQIETEREYVVDYYAFAQVWLDMFQPAIRSKRRAERRKRIVWSISDLKDNDIPLSDEILLKVIQNCPISDRIDEKIAACIIGIGN